MRVLLIIGILAASAQVNLPTLAEAAFDAVSIKPNTDPPRSPMTHQITPGRVHFVGVALRGMILDAFRIQAYQLFSSTNLLARTWDVEATMPTDSSPEQVASMLHAMLKERFGLQTHVEKRAIPVYLLTSVAGNKLQPTTDPSGRLYLTGGTPSTFVIGGRGPMSGLADLLGNNNVLDHPVFDRTGLDGRYQVNIEFSRGVNLQNGAGQDDLSAPSLFTVLKDRLGLKLELQKEEIDCVVVDKVDLTPTPS